MKSRIWLVGMGLCCALGGSGAARAASYYVNDGSRTNDVYTSALGNDSNPGTAALPKLTIGNVIGTCNLQPGDVVYIDTGTYAPNTISNTVVGAAGNPIVFQGSTNLATGGSTITGSGYLWTILAKYATFRDIRCLGGTVGMTPVNSAFCVYERVRFVSNSTYSVMTQGTGASTNVFRRCLMLGGTAIYGNAGRANQLENCVLVSTNGTALQSTATNVFTNMVGCILYSRYGFAGDSSVPETGSRNLFYMSVGVHAEYDTVAELERRNANWTFDTYADPLFANPAGLDFHLQSASGFVSNGVWVTNAAVGYSPAIDIGSTAGAAWASEPEPNGGRANLGMYGGTEEASKSRTGPWLFAMSFNDGGNLIQTGQLAWVASTNLGGSTVDLQYSTNNGAAWSNIATGVAANSETYAAWAPAFSHPATLWRVVCSTNAAIAATNAKPFSIRATTNTAFSFYVNDDSPTGDVYCSALGNNANLGVATNAPKRSLQAILDAYDLEAGDVVYVDTGSIATTNTTAISIADSGAAGLPMRIVGSASGSVFSCGSTSLSALEVNGARHVEISGLRLAGPGLAGLTCNGSSNVAVRNVVSTGNRWGFRLVGSAVQQVFDGCLAVDNEWGAFNAVDVLSRSNLWSNGTMWGNPTNVMAHANAPLSISNSIVGNASVLFAGAVVPGNYNVVWNTGVGLTYSTFSALQNAGLGWERCLYADPLFANASGGDYHLKSLLGRYSTNTHAFVTNDAVHSPAIDFGDPLAAVSNEPAPNGSRLNAGMFGGTAQASKSRTNAWLQVLSFMDGGTLDAAAGSWLRWDGGGFATTNTVSLWLSRDNGANWEILATNLWATNGAYFCQNLSTNDSSSPYAMWKVVLEADTNVTSQPSTNFTYRNGPFTFYVNDGSTNGDVYCSAVGNDGNLGVGALSPKANLHAVIEAYKLGPGDRVYVDTGAYTATNVVTLTTQDSGVATNPVVIVGSTNRAAGGSVFGLAGDFRRAIGLVFQTGASNIVLRDVAFTNMYRGVVITNSTGLTLDGVEVRGGVTRAFELQGNSRNVDLVHCVAHGGGVGIYLNQASNVSVRHCVLWQNTNNAIYVGNQVGVGVSNSVLVSTNAGAALYSIVTQAWFSADYNGLHAGPLARLESNRVTGVAADDLAAWQRLSGGQDAHSVPGDPQLADPAQYDYHLKTEQTLGRRLPNGQRTSDSVSSPLLDAGSPAEAVGDEPEPNGGRVNIGKYGGTWEASIALTTPWLRTITFGDAGGVSNGVVPLLWTAGGGLSNETVKVEVSVDGGATWSATVASNVPATNGAANWTVASLPDTPAGVWRVVCQENADVSARSTNFFAIRNSPLNIYLATADTNGTVYTSAPGASNNWQATAAAPLNSLRLAFDRFDLEAGDRIWVDTGSYSESAPIWVGPKDSGTSNDPVRVIGNRNRPYDATVLSRSSRTLDANGVQFLHAQGVTFDSIMISNAYAGVVAEHSQDLVLEQMRIGYCTTNAVYAGDGTRLELNRSIIDQNLYFGVMAYTGSVVKALGSLIRDNSRVNLYVRGGRIEATNSILEADGAARYVYYFGSTGSVDSDFNNIRVANGAYVAGYVASVPDRFLIDWQGRSTNDMSSFGYASLFADEENLDFHLLSASGRYDPGVGAFATNDAETSRLIDLGDFTSVWTNEPLPNGGRINVGLYGNTVEASKSSGVGTLVPLTMSDGGTIRGLATLYWSYNGITNNAWVNILFSADGGSNWTYVATNQYADQGRLGLPWVTTNFPSTAMGVWRVELAADTNVFGQTETLFAIKNEPLAYYVNDGSTNGDVYCVAAGSSANTGLNADAPLNSLETLLGRYKVEPGDTVYVDTGVYARNTPLVISAPSMGATNFLVIQGSTNDAAGGSVFTNSAGGAVIDLQNSRAVELRDLRLHGGGTGLLFTESSENRILRVRSVAARGNAFELSTRSDQNRFIQCAALGFSSTGFYVVRPPVVEIPPATNFWSSGVMAPIPAASNGTAVATGALVGALSGRIYVSNSVFVAASPAHVIYAVAADVVRGDYNCYHRPYSNLIASVALNAAFGMDRLYVDQLGAWSTWNLSDGHSLMADPLFADLAQGDLHPQSAGGRYQPADGTFANDDETSPLIDSADPAMDWSGESEPNGRRADMGVYGNDPQASRTPTNGTFVLLDYNQGGAASGVQTLRWIARGAAFTTAVYSVNVQLSTNGGATYDVPLGTNAALAGSFTWDTTAYPSLATARWRVQCREKIAWTNASEQDFTIHNTNLIFYVNDAATNNDVYATAAGAAANSGLSPASPLPSLAEVLGRYDLEAGDRVLIDTGEYPLSAPVRIDLLDGGTAANPVVIQGSTNDAGTAFAGAGIQFDNARGIVVRNVKFTAQTSLGNVATVSSSEDVALEQFDIFGAPAGGVKITTCSNVVLRNFTVAHALTNGIMSYASFNTRLEFGTIWSNGLAQIVARNQLIEAPRPEREASFVTVSNCILGAYGLRIPAFEVRGNLYANFNDFYLANGALAALSYLTGFGREFDTVGGWASSEYGQDGMSLSHNPRFANAGADDFHLKSTTGRWVSAAAGWTNDVESSPLIDAADPTLDFSAETIPNGGRANVGRYGNTAQASRTPTNGALTLISFNDGGRASGAAVPILWNARGDITNGTVSIYYSADGGSNWTTLATGIVASAGAWSWDSTLSAQSVQGQLKIVGSDDSSATSQGYFSVRNAPFHFYVNDSSTNNDVYCTAVGQGANSGLSGSAPMADLNALLAKYDLEGGDVVYIDTGVYKGGDRWQITQADSAGSLETDPVVFQGSTYSFANGTVLDRSFNPVGIQVDYAVGIRLRNIVVSNTVGSAVMFNDCYGAEAEWVAAGAANIGFRLYGGSQLRVAHCAAYDANFGVSVEYWNLATNTVFPVLEHNVFWDMATNAVKVTGNNRATVKHNVLSVQSGQYVYALGETDTLVADYNSIWLGAGGRVFRRDQYADVSPVPLIYDSVGKWAAVSSNDLHSYDGDPLLVNAAGRDFHLQSRTGRLFGTNWVQDAQSSPLIDAGDVDSTAWTNEPDPHGDRLNVGLYGGTPGASKSSTNSVLYLLTLNRGGVASGQVALNWMAAGLATGHTVRVEISIDDGASWLLVGAGIPANIGGVYWNSANQPSSALGLWRVLDEEESGVEATSEFNFVLHNEPVFYYVNDEFRDGDVYCSAAGSSANAGVATNAPKRWISEIFDTYNLEPGDVVYVDTGRYQTEVPTVIGDLDAGDVTHDSARQVNVVGSTNVGAGGSQYIFTDPAESAFRLEGAYGIRVSHLNVLGGGNGLLLTNCDAIAGDWLNVSGCGNGVQSLSSSDIRFSHSAMAGNRNAGIYFYSGGTGLDWMRMDSGLLWSNRFGLYLARGYAAASNTVFGMVAPNSFGYYVLTYQPPYGLAGDYNNLYVGAPGSYAGGVQIGADSVARTTTYASVSTWATMMGQDVHSLAHDPQLVDPGNGDYHLKSAGGRYSLGAGWVYDEATSPLIDAGEPSSTAWLQEPEPNGRRLNIGIYGGSAEASKTALDGTITLVSLNDGGSASGEVPLQWTVGGMATNYTVCLEYSPDNGDSWTNVACGIPAVLGGYLWNSVPYGRSALGLLRIYCVENTAIAATSLSPFVLRNGGTIAYYVNDASTNGDVYCTARGIDDNNGLTPATPKAGLQAILDAYELAPEDVVYVDAGTYVAGAPPIKIDQTDSGWSNLYVTIQGSTNPAAPTVYVAPSFATPCVFSMPYAVNVRLKDLTIRNAQMGIDAFHTIGCELNGCRIENNRSVGLNLNRCERTRVTRSVLWKNSSTTSGVAAALFDNCTLIVDNSVLWDSPTAISIGDGASLTVTNSVLSAVGTSGRIYDFSTGARATTGFHGDYNNYIRRNGALICEQRHVTGGSDLYSDLPGWSAVNGSDSHGMTIDPAFANEIAGDFHLKSIGGRFVPTTGTWTNDAILSPLVDAGPADWPCANEPAPNGNIVNLGAYGDTAQASMTQTNPPWLHAISYNDEGMFADTASLYWLYGGMPAGATVKLEYSTDAQISWKPIASNLLASSREYVWDLRTLPLSLCVNWRVVYEGNTNIWDSTDVCRPHDPGNLDFYVNDASTNNDVWCTGPGLALESGADPTNRAYPVNSLATLLNNYPVNAGDRIFVDTGTYPISGTAPVVIDGDNKGTASAPLRIYGSTNFQAGGALLLGNGTANGLDIQNSRYVELWHLRIASNQNGVAIQNASQITLNGVEAFNNLTNGVWLSNDSYVRIQNSRIWNNRRYGYDSTASQGSEDILSSTFWGNGSGAARTTMGLSISNSILGGTNSAPIYHEEKESANIRGDYNCFGVAVGGKIATNTTETVAYASLRQWQNKDRDLNSLVADPLFVDPANGNFHLQSRMGYWSNGTWTVATSTSWAIDAGDPYSPNATNEPEPNGGRLNLGAYGGTAQASLSDTNHPELFVLSLRDGGVAPNGQPLYWLFRGIDATNSVQIEWSPDGGVTWILVANGIPAGTQPYFWNSGCDVSPEAQWRVVLSSDTNIFSATPTNFARRPCPLIYYVNDAFTNGDVYCEALGQATNKGYLASSPMDTVQRVLSRYQLTAGDGILVDTGIYPMSTSIVLSVLTSGDRTNRVYVKGSTNDAAGGSWLQDGSGGKIPAFLLSSAHDIDVSHFHVSGFSHGVHCVEYVSDCTLADLDILGSVGAGILENRSTFIRMERTAVRDGMTNGIELRESLYGLIDSCVVWSNRASALYFGDAVGINVSNSVLQASGAGNYCYASPTNVNLGADYNDLAIANGGQVGSINGMQYEKLPQWVQGMVLDRHSLSTDPLFNDSTNGDFHLRSAAGRYQPGTGWVQDPVTGGADFSPLIDMGSPRRAWSNEPEPNGGRMNIGLYGNTSQASMSDTNPWLRVITAMSGGILSGGINLIWGSGGISSNALLRLEYSYNNGLDWSRIAEATAGAGEYFWQSDLKQAGIELWATSPGARWRLILDGDTNIWDMTDTYFGLRNSPFKYYVNDDSTNNDVYATAPGDDLNMGFYTAAPKLSLITLLQDVDLEPTDIVYIDTGLYWMADTNTPIRWESSDGGTTGQVVVVRGSTHPDGSRFITTTNFVPTPNGERGFFYVEASFVDMRNLRFEGESINFKGSSLVVSNLSLTNRAGGYPVAMNMRSDKSTFENIQIDRSSFSLSGQSNAVRRLVQRWGEAEIIGTNDVLRNSVVFTTNSGRTGLVVAAVGAVVSNCTVVSTRGSALAKSGYGALRLAHSILVAGGGISSTAVNWQDGGLVSDWNDLLARDGAWVGARNGKWEKLAYWQAASGQDANSVSFEPLFADEYRGDLHLKSEAGRWDPLLGAFRVDPGEHSPVIDLGNPWSPAGEEARLDWGYRLNLGAYGGSVEASKSRGDFWLTALTQNDGGVLKGTNVVLRWATGNAADKTVALQYFVDGAWTNIVTGLSAMDGSYAWDSTGFADGFSSYWRVVAEDGSGLSDQTDAAFALRNQTHNFYVNDTYDSAADNYATADGNDVANDGLTPATPKASLQAILNAYDLEGGDVVYVDSGTYVTNADTWIIWSRSGSTNADVVIQGNSNTPYATALTRSGSTNYPAVGIDVRASHVRLSDMEVRGINRGILLESNLNVTVQGVVVDDAATGLEVRGAQGTVVRDSAFWKTGIGVSLINAQTSTLENLTFALSTEAGIHLQNTVCDVLQNNIFMPAADAYAYSIGSATTLLLNATMDYNLYDFVSRTNTGFFAGGNNYYSVMTNDPVRRWQLAFGKDYRSAIVPADLADPEYTGDFHPKSTAGRWDAGGWVQDETNSWAIDHGHPFHDASREPDPNGARLNVGMYGNTAQASLSATNVYFEARTMNEAGFMVTSNDQTWVWAWFAHLVDSNETVAVQFSGDCGETWTTVTNVNAYDEYYVWRASPEFQTAGGSWRVIGNTLTNLWDANDYCFLIRYRDLGISSRPYPVSGLMRFEWEGGIQGRRYEIRYSDDFGKTWQLWEEKYNGPARINKSNFTIPVGGSQLSYTFEDRTSYLHRQRWYRIYQFEE